MRRARGIGYLQCLVGSPGHCRSRLGHDPFSDNTRGVDLDGARFVSKCKGSLMLSVKVCEQSFNPLAWRHLDGEMSPLACIAHVNRAAQVHCLGRDPFVC